MCFYLKLYGILNIETRLISELFSHWATSTAASASKHVLARYCSVQDSRIRSYFLQSLYIKNWQDVLLLETLWYLNIETRLISELFIHWATRPVASASKRVLARRCSVQDSRIRSYFFAMLAVVHWEQTDCSYKWFRKGERKCSQWSFHLNIVQKKILNT